MTPNNAHTLDALAALDRDNIETPSGLGLVLSEGHVSVHFAPGKWLEIPRDDFEIMAMWYLTKNILARGQRAWASSQPVGRFAQEAVAL